MTKRARKLNFSCEGLDQENFNLSKLNSGKKRPLKGKEGKTQNWIRRRCRVAKNVWTLGSWEVGLLLRMVTKKLMV